MKYSDEKDLSNYKKVNTDTWDDIKDNIRLRAINTKYLSEYGNHIAHKKFLDISLTLSLQEKQKQMLSYILTEDDLKKYDISFDEAFKVAKENSLSDRKRRILPLREYILQSEMLYPLVNVAPNAKMGVGNGAGVLDDIDDETHIENVVVLCNRTDTFGATYMCIPEILEEVYQRFNYENFYILPMSIHHAWCIRKDYATKNGDKPLSYAEDDLLSMVEEFNDTQNKSWKDILSYKIYYYIGDDGKHVFPIQ